MTQDSDTAALTPGAGAPPPSEPRPLHSDLLRDDAAPEIEVESVLSRASKSDIRTDPYPHIVIENALSESFYRRLAAEFPPLGQFLADERDLANTKHMRNGTDCLESELVTPLWKAFIAYHMSGEYYRGVTALFGDLLRDYHGEIEQVLGRPFEELSTGHRRSALKVPDMRHPYDVVLDCQPQLDYSFTARPFRGPHVDSHTEIYAGLLYMRAPEDDSEGGALAVWRAKDESEVFPRRRTLKADSRSSVIDRDKLELVYEIPYRANCFVMFVNSWRSLHCAQTRSPSLLPRRAVNIIGEICRFPRLELFDIERPDHLLKQSPKPSLLRRAAKRLLRR